ncbi:MULTISPECIES: hypothetical protein [Pandoraea]|uniref:hypothetical protein n=1 Tax=Pandoraea TaxID=93217 RepID=UPI001F5C9D83|nr:MULTISPECIES: hypothetical protein [Pandoraea]
MQKQHVHDGQAQRVGKRTQNRFQLQCFDRRLIQWRWKVGTFIFGNGRRCQGELGFLHLSNYTPVRVFSN